SLDVLSEWATTLFSGIKNKSIAAPSFPGHPLTESELGKQVFIKPVKDLRQLQITFPFPYMLPHYRAHPDRYVAHLIGHEGEGSILSLLKKKGWASGLSAYTATGGINFDFFKVSIDLTREGLSHYEETVVIVFQYIEMIRKTGVQEWVFRECQSLATISFRFKEKSPPSSYASRTAGSMHDYSPADILSGGYVIPEYDPAAIVQCIDALSVDRFKLTLISPLFETAGWNKADHYGTEYLLQDLSSELKGTGDNQETKHTGKGKKGYDRKYDFSYSPSLQALANLEPNPALALPSRNDFVPENFDLNRVDVAEPLKRPSIIKETPLTRLWHKKDDTFWVPKANVWFRLKSPISYASPLASNLTRLYADLLKDSLSEFSYYADVAGLSYALENSTDGIMLALGGYNDKLPILLKKIAERMRDLVIHPERFKMVKER
ncbi:Metalloenzyme, LuxS/M16 peptidase-like protein, partial [Blyttiomyces helicus]